MPCLSCHAFFQSSTYILLKRVYIYIHTYNIYAVIGLSRYGQLLKLSSKQKKDERGGKRGSVISEIKVTMKIFFY